MLILIFFNDKEIYYDYKFHEYVVDIYIYIYIYICIYIPEFNTAIMINENEYISCEKEFLKNTGCNLININLYESNFNAYIEIGKIIFFNRCSNKYLCKNTTRP